MPQIVREDIDNLHSVLTVSIETQEYTSSLAKKLLKLQKTADIKGFRKGMVPMTFVKKMFGKTALTETLDELVNQAMNSYLEENKIRIIGQPLEHDSQVHYDFNLNNPENFDFKFEIGIVPSFELNGVDKSQTFAQYKVMPNDADIDEKWEEVVKALSAQVEVDSEIGADDVVELHAEELENGSIKEGGVHTHFSISMDTVTAEAKQMLLGLNKGASINLNVYDLEKNTTKEFVRKYFLHIEQDNESVGEIFACRVEKITRVMKATPTAEQLSKYFDNPNVTDEEAAREVLRRDFSKIYQKDAKQLLENEIFRHIVGQNPMSFSKDFLKKWVKNTRENYNEEEFEANYEHLCKDLTWNYLKEKIITTYDVQLQMADIEHVVGDELAAYFGGQYNPQFVAMVMEKIKKDQKEMNKYAEKALVNKVFATLEDQFTIVEKPVSKEEFKNIINEEIERVKG